MKRLIRRSALLARVEQSLRDNPVAAIIGPRQCGKTTLARQLAGARRAEYFDLEDPRAQQRLANPLTAIEPLRGLIVIDEVQRRPDLFPVLRVLADRRPLPARFLLLGSASPELLQQGVETLAGRIAFIEMAGFDSAEVGADAQRKLWLRGGFPRSFLARSDAQSLAWREDFIRTFLERDIAQLGPRVAPVVLRRLWTMLAHFHGQLWNASELARSLGEAHTTVKRHLDLLTGALMLRQLQPWFENIGKRQVKAPKIYVRDSGLLHALLGLPSFRELEGHPKLGASWEGFVVEEIARAMGERHLYFWATQGGAELDLLVVSGGKKYGVEIKYADAPRPTRSMHIAVDDLSLARLFVVYPGSASFPLADKIEAVSLTEARRHLAGSRR